MTNVHCVSSLNKNVGHLVDDRLTVEEMHQVSCEQPVVWDHLTDISGSRYPTHQDLREAAMKANGFGTNQSSHPFVSAGHGGDHANIGGCPRFRDHENTRSSVPNDERWEAPAPAKTVQEVTADQLQALTGMVATIASGVDGGRSQGSGQGRYINLNLAAPPELASGWGAWWIRATIEITTQGSELHDVHKWLLKVMENRTTRTDLASDHRSAKLDSAILSSLMRHTDRSAKGREMMGWYREGASRNVAPSGREMLWRLFHSYQSTIGRSGIYFTDNLKEISAPTTMQGIETYWDRWREILAAIETPDWDRARDYLAENFGGLFPITQEAYYSDAPNSITGKVAGPKFTYQTWADRIEMHLNLERTKKSANQVKIDRPSSQTRTSPPVQTPFQRPLPTQTSFGKTDDSRRYPEYGGRQFNTRTAAPASIEEESDIEYLWPEDDRNEDDSVDCFAAPFSSKGRTKFVCYRWNVIGTCLRTNCDCRHVPWTVNEKERWESGSLDCRALKDKGKCTFEHCKFRHPEEKYPKNPDAVPNRFVTPPKADDS
jgi:hypothetical protein